jgi:hypothetical protein
MFSLAISTFIIGIIVGIYIAIGKEKKVKKRKKKKKLPFPECNLRCDPNQCDTWCMAKERFKNDPSL